MISNFYFQNMLAVPDGTSKKLNARQQAAADYKAMLQQQIIDR